MRKSDPSAKHIPDSLRRSRPRTHGTTSSCLSLPAYSLQTPASSPHSSCALARTSDFSLSPLSFILSESPACTITTTAKPRDSSLGRGLRNDRLHDGDGTENRVPPSRRTAKTSLPTPLKRQFAVPTGQREGPAAKQYSRQGLSIHGCTDFSEATPFYSRLDRLFGRHKNNPSPEFIGCRVCGLEGQ